MQKEITCTECANHCRLTVEQKGEEIVVTGNRCPRGLKSGTEEFLGQRQVVRGFVRSSVEGVGKIPVYTSKSVPKGMVYKVTLALKRVCVEHPVCPGEIVAENISNTGANLIVSEQ